MNACLEAVEWGRDYPSLAAAWRSVRVAHVAVAAASWSYRDSLPEETRVPLVLFGVALLAFGLVIAFYRYLVWSATQYVITSRRVILIRGIYAKETFDSSLDFINDLHLRQSFWGRLLGFGHIDVLTASEDTNEGQEIIAKNYYRPTSPEVLAKHRHELVVTLRGPSRLSKSADA